MEEYLRKLDKVIENAIGGITRNDPGYQYLLAPTKEYLHNLVSNTNIDLDLCIMARPGTETEFVLAEPRCALPRIRSLRPSLEELWIFGSRVTSCTMYRGWNFEDTPDENDIKLFTDNLLILFDRLLPDMPRLSNLKIECHGSFRDLLFEKLAACPQITNLTLMMGKTDLNGIEFCGQLKRLKLASRGFSSELSLAPLGHLELSRLDLETKIESLGPLNRKGLFHLSLWNNDIPKLEDLFFPDLDTLVIYCMGEDDENPGPRERRLFDEVEELLTDESGHRPDHKTIHACFEAFMYFEELQDYLNTLNQFLDAHLDNPRYLDTVCKARYDIYSHKTRSDYDDIISLVQQVMDSKVFEQNCDKSSLAKRIHSRHMAKKERPLVTEESVQKET